MSEFDILLEEHASSDCKECLIKAYNLGAREELGRLLNAFFDSDSGKHIRIYAKKRLRELKGLGK